MKKKDELRTMLSPDYIDTPTLTLTGTNNNFDFPTTLTLTDPEIKVEHTGIDYKYNEGKLLDEIRRYINNTYGEHYSQNQYQATEFIIDGGHGVGFTLGNILKYAQRYGHKGDAKEWRKDLMKVIHYAIIALHVHDLQYKKD